MQIHNKVRMLRLEHDEMTQEQLAQKTQVTRQTIAAIENNKYSPSLELAFKIAEIFNLPIGEVFSYESSDDLPDVDKDKGGGHRNRNSSGR